MSFARPLDTRFRLRRDGVADAGQSPELGARAAGPLYRAVCGEDRRQAGLRTQLPALPATDRARARDVDDHAMPLAAVAEHAARGHDADDDRADDDGDGRSGRARQFPGLTDRFEGLRQGRGSLAHGSGPASIVVFEHMCIISVLFCCLRAAEPCVADDISGLVRGTRRIFAVAVYGETSTLANKLATKSRV